MWILFKYLKPKVFLIHHYFSGSLWIWNVNLPPWNIFFLFKNKINSRVCNHLNTCYLMRIFITRKILFCILTGITAITHDRAWTVWDLEIFSPIYLHLNENSIDEFIWFKKLFPLTIDFAFLITNSNLANQIENSGYRIPFHFFRFFILIRMAWMNWNLFGEIIFFSSGLCLKKGKVNNEFRFSASDRKFEKSSIV